jgi:hypothetical protein
MSFIASCPFCRRKVKAPERALGQSFACQRCQNYFTLAPDDDAALQVQAQSSSGFEIAAQADPQAAPAASPPRSAPAAPRAAAPDDAALTETARQLEPLTARVLPVLNEMGPVAAPVDRPGWHTIGVIALFLGGIALAFASIPGLQWLTIPFAGLGLIAGAFGLMVDYTPQSEEWTPKVGAILCAVLLVVAFAWPALLGLDPKVAPLPPPVDPNRQLVQPRGDKGPGGPRPSPQPLDKERWVEADLYDVDHGMVRLRIMAAALQDVPVNLRKDRRRAERELALTVKLVHAGTKDPIAFKGWRAAGDSPRLLDGNGQVLAFRPRGDGAAPRALVPFQPVQETVAFDPPAAASDFVRLELPASAFGGAGTVRFLVPRTMFAR